MVLKKIQQQLHRFLFPRYTNRLTELLADTILLKTETYKLREVNKKLDTELKVMKTTVTPSLADLMREVLGLEQLDFTNVVQSEDIKTAGLPRHFLDTENKDKRAAYIAQLEEIYNTEVWHEMVKYHKNYQGNFSFRKALDDMQIFAGRMSVNGISLLQNDVQFGHDEYAERSKPPEEFDKFETTEGFTIKKDEE